MSDFQTARMPVTDEVDGEYGVHVIDLTDEELQAVNPLAPSERLVIYPFLRKYFVKGALIGAVKE